jgi:uncharacterized protein YjiS (DUF1127 family)
MLTALTSAIRAELRVRRAVAELATMDDDTLRDFGIGRGEIESIVRGGRKNSA